LTERVNWYIEPQQENYRLNLNSTDPSAPSELSSVPPISRRRFLTTSVFGGAGLALYSGEIERHWIDIANHDLHLRSLPSAFEGMKIVQLSDIHLDEFTEPFLLRQAVDKINRINPDAIFLTGDYVSYEIAPKKYAVNSGWQCAEILNELKCKRRFAILGNHDAMLGEKEVTEALVANGMTVLNNTYLPLERAGSRIWLIGLDDPVCGRPDPNAAIPASIRNVAGEPVIVLCHAPDYADTLLTHPAGKSVDLMLSGHTHGGQVRLPFVGALNLPIGGRKYPEGWFKVGSMQLYVNRGIGTIGVPFRFDCPPEITVFTLRSGLPQKGLAGRA
jgi:predicted MPP superfamily phosphohydrolase